MDLIIYGSGSTGCEIVDIAERINKAKKRWENICFVDDIRVEREFYQRKVMRFEEMINEKSDYECVIAQGEPVHRRMLYDKLCKHFVKLATVIDPTAVISDNAVIAAGCVIGPNSFVSCHARLDENVMLEIHTIVGHDVTVGKHSIISSSSVIGGHTSIGEESFIGLNCTLKEKLTIGAQCIVGMGSCVFNNIEDGMIAMGNPARVLRRNEEHRVFKG